MIMWDKGRFHAETQREPRAMKSSLMMLQFGTSQNELCKPEMR